MMDIVLDSPLVIHQYALSDHWALGTEDISVGSHVSSTVQPCERLMTGQRLQRRQWFGFNPPPTAPPMLSLSGISSRSVLHPTWGLCISCAHSHPLSKFTRPCQGADVRMESQCSGIRQAHWLRSLVVLATALSRQCSAPSG